ncbi:hypothetical protein ACFFVB_13770 [Formosa undariae]|uniref:TonB-dependent receptor plug domain-containing protein n=1 Tax=Formosa undariae TaxID=1325436 RepID=A0ABV5F3X9_9FLAO
MKRNEPHKKDDNPLKVFGSKLILVVAFLTLFLCLLPACVSAQNNNEVLSNAVLAEKVYLQLDRDVYTTDNTIWFKSIILNAYSHAPSTFSGVLYVELISPEETIRDKKLIKIKHGIGQGFFNLDSTFKEGVYLIRAYTEWNKNFETDFLFEDYIQVFNTEQDDNKEIPIRNVTLIKDQANKNRLKASFNPLAIDSAHKNKLTVIVTLGDKKDTLLVKKGQDKKYWIDYPIPTENQFVTLQMQTENKHKKSKTIVLNEDYLDFQCFPESGELVHGLPSKMGFKTLDANGQGKEVQGDIIDEMDAIVTTFKSNALGMGSFLIAKADSTKTYFARLMPQALENETTLYPLPDVASRGHVLSVEKHGNNMLITALSNYNKNDSIFIGLSFRGMHVYNIKVKLKDGIFKLLFPATNLPEGIIACVMKDNVMQPIAERLYYNENPKNRINIALSTHEKRYSKRELTHLEITTTNSNGDNIKANTSVLVINKEQMGQMQSKRQNILSWFLLNSELKGHIENPGFYFNKNISMHSHLDALMLTQGWRKYHYAKLYKALPFKPEANLSVSGQVSSVFSKKRKKEAKMTMITFGENKSFYNQTADSLGLFKFNLNDEYGEQMKLLIQSSNASGKKKDFNVLLDEKKSYPVHFNPVKTVVKLDSIIYKFVEKNRQRKEINDEFFVPSDNVLLEEVELTGYNLTPERKKIMERFGEPDEVINGDDIREKEEKWSYGLYSVLQSRFSDKINILRGPDGALRAIVNTTKEPTLVVIDGIPVMYYDYTHIADIPPSEVSSFEIIEHAKNFVSLFLEVYPGTKFPPTYGNVIAIYTYGKKGLYGTTRPVGIMQSSIPVFSEPLEFYAPKYETIKSSDWNTPDLRALVHWEPIVKTDNDGKASTSFYNADNEGEMMIVVEAVSEKGEIGYQIIDYELTAAKNK